MKNSESPVSERISGIKNNELLPSPQNFGAGLIVTFFSFLNQVFIPVLTECCYV
jgi:hypothetical protein